MRKLGTFIGDKKFIATTNNAKLTQSPEPSELAWTFETVSGALVAAGPVAQPTNFATWAPAFNIVITRVIQIAIQQKALSWLYVDNVLQIETLIVPQDGGQGGPQGSSAGVGNNTFAAGYKFNFPQGNQTIECGKGLLIKGGSTYRMTQTAYGTFAIGDTFDWQTVIFYKPA